MKLSFSKSQSSVSYNDVMMTSQHFLQANGKHSAGSVPTGNIYTLETFNGI